MIDYLEIFEDIVDGLRQTGDISNITESAGVSTIVSANTLSKYEYIEMNSVGYMVTSASATEFTVEATGLTATSWKARAPYFIYDTPLKMVDIVLERTGNNELKYQNYPLIYLKLNIKEERDNEGYYATLPNLEFIILTITNPDYIAPQRKELVFKPVLWPLYESFVEAIEQSTYFNETELILTKEDNYFWGTKFAENNKNILNDPIDAIEMNINALSILKRCDS